MELSLFDYHLPKEQVAQEPARPRDSSRLMVLRREETIHERFFRLPEYLKPGDVLVLNETRVIPARLDGRKRTGGKLELTLLTPYAGGVGRGTTQAHDSTCWTALIKGKKIRPGMEILLAGGWRGRVLEQLKEGEFCVEFAPDEGKKDFHEFIQKHGRLPLPPYIRKEPEEQGDYQTIYARQEGSVAAPTAGLHFTDRVFSALEKRGVRIAKLTLHVGPGTFLPVKCERVEDHVMHGESYVLDAGTASTINAAIEAGGRLVAVGTTSHRVLEAVAGKYGELREDRGSTELFIYPGYRFKSGVELLLTNFHLPRSTLLMLVSAFAGRERILEAYEEAKKREYRFFSFGDAMLLEKA